jgi:uncharacterized protein YkwD
MRALRSLCSTLLAVSAALLLLPGAGYGDAERPPRCGAISQSPEAATDHQLRTSVLCLVNLARERHGIPPLEFNLELRQSATAHSLSMVRSGSLTHYGPGGSTLTTRLAHSGYLASVSSYRVAENIGAGEGREYGSPIGIVKLWMNSVGHRANILDPGLHDFGVGVARGNPLASGDDAATYTLDFGARQR